MQSANDCLNWVWLWNADFQTVNWRDRLHRALASHLGREPTGDDLSYHTEGVRCQGGEGFRTTVVVGMPPPCGVRQYTGAACAHILTAIASAAWVALGDLCRGQWLEPPREVCR